MLVKIRKQGKASAFPYSLAATTHYDVACRDAITASFQGSGHPRSWRLEGQGAARTHRLTREARNFTKLVLPGKGHLGTMMAGFIRWPFVGRLNSYKDQPRTPKTDPKNCRGGVRV